MSSQGFFAEQPLQGAATRQPKPRRPKRRSEPPQRGSGLTRVISLEASAGVHLAVLILLLAWSHFHPETLQPPVVPSPVPIDIAVEPQPLSHAVPAPPGPVHHDKAPKPKAPEAPHLPPHPQAAAAHHPRPPRPAMLEHRVHANHPAQRQYHAPKAADLQALLQRRLASGKSQDEQRLAQLRNDERSGAEHANGRPAGLPAGNPHTSGSAVSGEAGLRGVLVRVRPVYPMSARRDHDGGDVGLSFVVHADGSVGLVSVIASSGRGDLDRAAVAAMHQWRFRPLPGSTGPDQSSTITMHFHLD